MSSTSSDTSSISPNYANIDIPNYILEQLDIIAKENDFIDYKFEFDDGSNYGDGFVAKMLNIIINGSKKNQPIDGEEIKTNQHLSLICKLAPVSKERRKLFNIEKVFHHEAYAYNDLLPLFMKFQNEKQIPKEKSFLNFPRCFYAISDEPKNEHAIIMEDLRFRGFSLWDKIEPITFDHVKSFLIALGRFHGLSFALKDQQPLKFNEFRKLKNLIIDSLLKQPIMTQMFATRFKIAGKMLESTKIGEIIKSMGQNWLKGYTESMVADEKFSVIAHGDCWNNNVMFNQKMDITILDWQTYQFGSPAKDFSHFILSSTQKDLRAKHINDFLHIYYDNLAEMIRLCGSKPEHLYSFEDFQNQLKKHGRTILYMMPTMVGVLVDDQTEKYQRIYDVFNDAVAYGWLEVP